MSSLLPFARSCASHVSCVASVDVVSDSAKLRITSRKEGMEPVVMALTRGMVIVGDVACAVKGTAVPSLIRLQQKLASILNCRASFAGEYGADLPLHKFHPAFLAVYEVTS